MSTTGYTITARDLRAAAVAACRVIWQRTDIPEFVDHFGTWDQGCHNKAEWIHDEIEALRPALDALGITVGIAPPGVPGPTVMGDDLLFAPGVATYIPHAEVWYANGKVTIKVRTEETAK